jgi:hypothetical protein
MYNYTSMKYEGNFYEIHWQFVISVSSIFIQNVSLLAAIFMFIATAENIVIKHAVYDTIYR